MVDRDKYGAQQLEILQLRKTFGTKPVVANISLRVAFGEFVVILGPSGSGKSTLLSMVGGHLIPDSGDIRLEGRSIVGLPPDRIDVVTIFQDYALFPHLSVAENIAFGLRMRKTKRPALAARVRDMVRLFRLEGLERRRVVQLSGGEQQRVATARALAVDPSVILMDEPLGALDRAIKSQLQQELRDTLREIGTTTLYVTHDQSEGLAMADRIAVMNGGAFEQIGDPSDVYANPASDFVATFLGGANVLVGEVVGAWERGITVIVGGSALQCRGSVTGRNARIALRPEAIHLYATTTHMHADTFTRAHGTWFVQAVVRRRTFCGSNVSYDLSAAADAGGLRFTVLALGSSPFDVGDCLWAAAHPGAASVISGTHAARETTPSTTTNAPSSTPKPHVSLNRPAED